ncbi:MAG: fumarylacetoacetate hydrolase family protein [Betaproteobacteria bacterium]|nr:fumarylacetoacetate hydrolase family protein [Betaproteobacteria bacterium]
MSASRTLAAARALFEAHERRERFGALPSELVPRTPEEAYLVQDDFVAMRAQRLGAVSGYKIALSTPAMQKFVGVGEPMAGTMLYSTLRRSPCAVKASDYVNLIVEFEIAVELAEDLPAIDAPFGRERVAATVGAVMPAIELADDRGADYTSLSRHPLELIADNCWNEGTVLGESRTDWRQTDLAAVRGSARINGVLAGRGLGADTMGHPLAALAWVADNLAARGRGMVRGDIVITGSLVTTKQARAGDLISWEIDELGAVELRVE